MLSSAIVFFPIFATAVQAWKAGCPWPYYNRPLNPEPFSNPTSKIVAVYDWETYEPPASGSFGDIEFIGMQRCLDCDSSPVAQLQDRWRAQGWKTVYTLNEPDVNGISPAQAAAWYIEYVNPLTIQKALPAVTSSVQPGQGLEWVSAMITACAGQCYFDFVNLHWYGSSFAEFQSYIEEAHAQFPNIKLVISEFALQNPPGGQADQVNFFQQAINFLESLDYVDKYFAFVATSPELFLANDPAGSAYVGTGSCYFNNDGSVSAVGELFL